MKYNPEVRILARKAIGRIKDIDVVKKNFEPFKLDDYKDKILWLWYPGRSQLNDVAAFVLKPKLYKACYLIVPDLVCDAWYEKIGDLPNGKWYGLEPEGDASFWIPRSNTDSKSEASIYKPGVTWWLVKFTGN